MFKILLKVIQPLRQMLLYPKLMSILMISKLTSKELTGLSFMPILTYMRTLWMFHNSLKKSYLWIKNSLTKLCKNTILTFWNNSHIQDLIMSLNLKSQLKSTLLQWMTIKILSSSCWQWSISHMKLINIFQTLSLFFTKFSSLLWQLKPREKRAKNFFTGICLHKRTWKLTQWSINLFYKQWLFVQKRSISKKS